MKTTPIRTHPENLSCLLLISMAVLAAVSSEAAGKPGGGGGGDTPTGTIYFIGPPAEGSSDTWAMNSMDPNGGNISILGAVQGHPSRVPYGNHRFFIGTYPIPGEINPDGTPRVEVCAFRWDFHRINNNNLSTRVQLTDDPSLKPSMADWMPDGGSISFVGRRWVSTEPGAPVEHVGMYTAPLALDETGALVGLAEEPTGPVIVFPLVEAPEGYPEGLYADLAYYGWDGTGSMVAYSSLESRELRMADLFGTHTTIYQGLTHMPVWSPDGTRIAFGNDFGISTIQPNGQGLKRIIRNTSDWFFVHAMWDPTGGYLVFTGESYTGSYNFDIFRATASGRDLVNLTNTPVFPESTREYAGGWAN
jgi:hypothetical protein